MIKSPIIKGLLIASLILGAASCSTLALGAPAPVPATTRAPISTPSVIPDAPPAQAALPLASQPTAATQPAVSTAAAIASPTPALALPAEHFISNIHGHHQYFSLGCEAAAAKDWAKYFGQDFNEFEFQYKLPLSDNPDLGFVGDVNAPWGQVPPYGYGVHAGPVADLLNAYGIPAKAYKGFTLDQLKARLAQDKPVIAWVIGNVVGGVPYQYTDSRGSQVTVAAYEHVVIVTGYDATRLRYMTNGKFFESPYEIFLNSWGVLGNMVIVDN